MGNLKCPICSSQSDKCNIFPAKEMTLGTRVTYNYALCNSCQSLFITKIPDNYTQLYDAYPLGKNLNLRSQNPYYRLLTKTLFSKISVLRQISYYLLKSYRSLPIRSMYPHLLNKSQKVLDVGCGSGTFVLDLLDAGFQNVTGIDPFIPQDREIRPNAWLRKMQLTDVRESFDLIIFNHSFEHLFNFHEICKNIFRILIPGGHCVIRLPNVDSLSFRLFGKYWEGIHPPFHTALPSRQGLIKLLEMHDLKHIHSQGEQPHQLLFYSLNRLLNVADFDKDGALNFFLNKPLFKSTPPLFRRKEYRCLKQLSNRIHKHKSLSADYIAHCFKK